MPIPTKTLSSKIENAKEPVRRVASTRSVRSATANNESQDNSDKASETSTASAGTGSNPTQSRLQPRTVGVHISGTMRTTRTVSKTSDSSKSASIPTVNTSRSTSSTSRITRPATTTHPSTLASNLKPKTTSSISRPAPTNTRTTAPIATSKLRPTTSSSQPASKVSRSIPTNSTSASRTKSGTAKTETPAPSSTIHQQPSSRLHDELFQLQLLHSQSHQPLQAYRTSIENRLSQKHTQLLHLQTQVLTHESQTNAALSIQALDTWLNSTNYDLHNNPIRILSSTISELDKLKDDNCETLAPLHRFDGWLAQALAIREERMTGSETLEFVQSLGADWGRAMRELQAMLALIVDTLRGWEEVDEGSGIGVVIARHRVFAGTLLQEVETAVGIEKEIMRAERAWEVEELGGAMESLLAERRTAADGEEGRYAGIWAC